MFTLILPGFSEKNKDWAEEVKKNLKNNSTVVSWAHWETGRAEKDWTAKEAENIGEKYKNKTINIIAKSMGTVVTMYILQSKVVKVNKLILCGIPLGDLYAEDFKYFTELKNFPTNNLL